MYRIITSDKNLHRIEAVLVRHKIDYTVFRTQGSWRQHPERSLVIETFSTDKQELQKVAQIIGIMNEQDAVILQFVPDTTFVYSVQEDKWESPIGYQPPVV